MKLIFIFLITLLTLGCSAKYQNQTITGQVFPSITGEDLEHNTYNIPEDLSGKPTLLLIGYKQNAQFDIDRWLIALDVTDTKIAAYELPTIQGLFPRMFSTMINNGMRAGIPKPLWKGVITVYKDGELVQAFTGNENPNNARVILLDKHGVILYAYDKGFSVQALNDVKAFITE